MGSFDLKIMETSIKTRYVFIHNGLNDIKVVVSPYEFEQMYDEFKKQMEELGEYK